MSDSESKSKEQRTLAAVLGMLVTAVLFSTGGTVIKLSGLDGWQVAGGRSLVAAISLWLLVPASRRHWRSGTWGVGLAYALTLLLFVHANKLTTAASTIFLQGASPLYLVVLGPLFLGEPLRRRDLILVPVLAVGLGLFFLGADPESATAPRPVLGNFLAFSSGVSYAIVIIGLRALGRRSSDVAPHPAKEAGVAVDGRAAIGSRAALGSARPHDAAAAAVVCGNLIAAVACIPGALPLAAVAPADLWILLYLGLFQIGLAYALMVRAIRKLSALDASLLLLLEPALSPLWAFLVVGEKPGPWTWIGGAVLVGGTALHAFATFRSYSRSKRPV